MLSIISYALSKPDESNRCFMPGQSGNKFKEIAEAEDFLKGGI